MADHQYEHPDHEQESSHQDNGAHGHTHGVVDPSIISTERGIWAIKWSFIALFITALLQMGVVIISDSVALLADTTLSGVTIHVDPANASGEAHHQIIKHRHDDLPAHSH